MAVTDHYDFWHLDPDEEISDFPSTWNYNIDDIDAAIYGAATNNVALSRLPNLPAGKVTSGTFAQARIPNLPASQTTTGTFADARIPTSIARTADVDDETAALKQRIEELENANRTTGTRNISNFATGLVSGEFLLSRSGGIVQFSAIGTRMENLVSGSTFMTLPSGFRPVGSLYAISSNYWGSDSPEASVRLGESGEVSIRASDDWKASFSFTYLTPDSWPSNLPGDPA